jgi:hypothetical protein
MIQKSMDSKPISFVVAVNNEKVFRANVLASPIFREGHPHEIIVQRDYPSASLAYNHALAGARHDLIVFMHQDVYLPDAWVDNLHHLIDSLAESERRWGVLGCYGVTLDGVSAGHIFSNGLNRELGRPQSPVQVQSLDESVLILRKSNGLRFDSKLPHFHLYGTDICLEAKRRGFENYAISNYCVHNSLPVQKLPPEFWRCAEYLRVKWQNELPVKTCCAILYPRQSKMWLSRAIFELKFFRKRRGYLVSERLKNPEAQRRQQSRIRGQLG